MQDLYADEAVGLPQERFKRATGIVCDDPESARLLRQTDESGRSIEQELDGF